MSRPEEPKRSAGWNFRLDLAVQTHCLDPYPDRPVLVRLDLDHPVLVRLDPDRLGSQLSLSKPVFPVLAKPHQF